MNVEKLPRSPMRREDEPGYEKEIWQPSWQCFCCHDTGIINAHLATLVIDGYDSSRDKFPRCVNPGCRAGSHWDSEAQTKCVDYRINAATCQQLDLLERNAWRKTVQAQSQRIQETTKALAREKSFRVRDRNAYEEQVSLERHRLVVQEDWGLVAATSAEKKWLAG